MQPQARPMASPAPVQAEVKQAPAVQKKRGKVKPIVISVLVALLLTTSGVLAFKYNEAQAQLKKLSNPQEAAKVETENLVKKVSKIAALPHDETPTVATVVDAGKLKSQAFFANAENQDKVLMYTKAKKAFLYRPSSNKIIEVAPIDVSKTQQQQQSSSNTTTQPKR